MNKRFFSVFFLIAVLSAAIFSQEFQILNKNVDVQGAGFSFLGKTKPYSLFSQYPLDTKKVFTSEEELTNYLENYKKTLLNTRLFETVDIKFYPVQNDETNSQITFVSVDIFIQDSHHLLMMPYPKFSSNTGFSFKLKAKDSNFLGSMKTLSSEIKLDISNEGFIPGFAIDFNFPFKLGFFDAQWVNDYEISYIAGSSMPEWDLKSGLKLKLPINNHSLIFEMYQYFFKEFDYIPYNDDMYFKEEVALSSDISIFTFDNYTNLYFTPKLSFYYNWDFDGININNNDLSSPSISFSNTLFNEKINWNDNFRTGYSASLVNSYTYNLQRMDFSPFLSANVKLFYDFTTSTKRNFLEHFGISTNIYCFSYFYYPGNSYFYGEQIGEYLRGILDKSFFGNVSPEYTASSAFIINIDLPHHLFTTHFSKEIFNVNVQTSPFFDAALVLNREKNTLFSLKDGYYCAGLEILIYPLKWSSYTLRASFGFDIMNVLKSDSLIQGLLKHNEFFFGIGLQY